MLKLNAVGLFVNDMEKTVRFYRDVMGMRTDKKYSYPNGLNGTVELAFDVADFAQVDAEYERVTKAGAIPVFPPTEEPWGQRTSYVANPDGNLIEISSFVRTGQANHHT